MISYLKKKNLKLRTLVSLRKNQSLKMHDDICLFKKRYNKKF